VKKLGLVLLLVVLLVCTGCGQKPLAQISEVSYLAKNDTWTRVYFDLANGGDEKLQSVRCMVQVYAGSKLVETESFKAVDTLYWDDDFEFVWDVNYPKNPQNTEDITTVKVAIESYVNADGKTVDFSKHPNWVSSGN